MPSLDDWEKGWERGMGNSAERRAQSGKDTADGFMSPPKLLPVDFQLQHGVSQIREAHLRLVAGGQPN